MRLYQDKRERRRIIFSWLTFIIVLIIATLLLRAVLNIYPKYKLANESRRTIQIEENTLDKRRKQLERDISVLSSGTGEEAALRSKYQVSSPGEEVLIIIDGKANPTSDGSLGVTDYDVKQGTFDYIKSLFVR
ncbi:MAG: hypothetical protein HZA95_02110 [Candidatus Vogelbacteria bacterium]|nr:hypothetical protein [Candidatus Vogelbacteria bacterium]